MSFLIDSDILIYLLNGNEIVRENFLLHDSAVKVISVISYGELHFGAEKSLSRERNLARIRTLEEILPVIDVTPGIMAAFGALKAGLQRQGMRVDDFDLVIASTAIAQNYTLVTNNERHFSKIPGIRILNWAKRKPA